MDEDRIYREKLATVIRGSGTIGSVTAFQSPITTQIDWDWLASKLKIGKESASTWMRIRPRKKDGIEYRMNAALVAMLSPMVLRLTAWKMPSGMAIATASTSEIPDRYRLRAVRSWNSARTDWFST